MTISFNENKELPQMKQYREFKKKHPTALLLFRCGDFYEAYEDDARNVAKVCGVKLTRQNDTQIAGFPHHALDVYLPKLVRAGYKVAIVDEYEDPKRLKKLAKRTEL